MRAVSLSLVLSACAAPPAPATVTLAEPLPAPASPPEPPPERAPPTPSAHAPPNPFAMCCVALQQTANAAPDDQRPYYLAAAKACLDLPRTKSAQEAYGYLRAFLAGARMPAVCQ